MDKNMQSRVNGQRCTGNAGGRGGSGLVSFNEKSSDLKLIFGLNVIKVCMI